MSVPAPTAWLSTAVRSTPEAPALIAGSLIMSYAELAGAAERWRAELADLDLPGPSNLGVVVRRNPQSMAQLWAVWESPHTALLLDAAALDGRDESLFARWGVAALVDGENMVEVHGPSGAADPAHHSWILTSGSSGAPRPVILTHDNVAAAVAASQTRLRNDAADRWQLVLPPAHVGGASVLWRSAAAGGAVVLDEGFDPSRTAQRFADGAITISSLVPTMLYRLLDHIDEVSPEVRAVLVGGAAANEDLLRRALEVGLPVLATYGLTEACSQVATVAPGEMWSSVGTVGRPLGGMSVTVSDPDPTGAGEITIDGPAVTPGYGGEPLRAGPHRTGDLGRIDDSGRLVVLGRTDGVIVTGGENVVPATVERALEAFPGLQQAAVVGLPDDEWGEIVVACVVTTSGAAMEGELRSHARKTLAAADRPKRYVFVESLPELPNGKIDRSAVRSRIATGDA